MRTPALVLLSFALLAGCETASTPTAPTPTTAYRKTTPAAATAAPDIIAQLKPADAFEAALLKPPVKIQALAEHAQKLDHLANIEDNADTARDLRRRAYAFADAAKKAGSDDLMLPLILAAIRPDGTKVPVVHSDNAAVNQLLTEGETKFGRGDFDGALTCYQKALELDPKSYRAALFAGDVFFSKQEPAAAVTWFDRAIAIDPNQETAYRYRADALMRLGRTAEAGEGYINAFLSAPFTPIPTTMLNRWIAGQGLTLSRPDPHFPVGSLQVRDGKFAVVVDPQASGPLGLMYAIARNKYADDHKIAPADYRHSLAEEIEALHTMLIVGAELEEKDPNDPETKAHAAQVHFMTQLEQDGLLPAFILLDRPTEGIAKDYPAYLAQHRDVLVRYINTVWLKKA